MAAAVVKVWHMLKPPRWKHQDFIRICCHSAESEKESWVAAAAAAAMVKLQRVTPSTSSPYQDLLPLWRAGAGGAAGREGEPRGGGGRG